MVTGGHCRAGARAEVSSGTGGADCGHSSFSGSAGGGGGLQGSRAGQGSTAADMEQIVDIPACSRGLEVFAQDRVPQLPHRVGFLTMRMKEFKLFWHFSQAQESAEVTRQSSPRVPASVSPSELSARQLAPAGESDELEDEPGDALDAAVADTVVAEGFGEGGLAEAEAVVQSSSPQTAGRLWRLLWWASLSSSATSSSSQ